MKAPNGDVFYELNREHPAIKSLSHSGVSSSTLEAALKQIERGLPLNQLYVDLNNDEHFVNDSSVSEDVVRSALNDMLDGRSGNERKALLDALRYTEPFDDFPALLDSLM